MNGLRIASRQSPTNNVDDSLDLPKDHGWSQGAVGLYSDWCSCLCWHYLAWPIDTNWLGSSLCTLPSSLARCAAIFREHKIEFEKLDAHFGYGRRPEFVPKFIAGNVGWKLNHFMRSAGTLSSWKWKATRCLWCEDFLIQTIRNAQEPPQQPAPKCWYCQEEGTVLPHPKTPSTRTSHLEIHETVGMLMQSFIVEDAAGHAPHAWPWNCRSTSCRWLCKNVGAFVPWWPCSSHDYAYIDRTAVDNGACYIPLEEQKERWWSGTCCWTFETFAGWFFERLAACNERSA